VLKARFKAQPRHFVSEGRKAMNNCGIGSLFEESGTLLLLAHHTWGASHPQVTQRIVQAFSNTRGYRCSKV